jgi:hypothetical protein
MASPDSVFLVPQRKSSDSGFHRELKVFLRLYVTRFPGERIRNSSEVCRNFCPLFIFVATEGITVSKEKASCGLLGGFSGRLAYRADETKFQAFLLRASPGIVGSIAQIR